MSQRPDLCRFDSMDSLTPIKTHAIPNHPVRSSCIRRFRPDLPFGRSKDETCLGCLCFEGCVQRAGDVLAGSGVG